MKNGFHIASIVLVLGMLLAPKITLACDNMKSNSKMACCKKNKPTETHIKNCCQIKKIAKKSPTQKPTEKTTNDCDDCDQNYCSCAPITLSVVIPAHFILENKAFNLTKAPQKFSYSKAYVSSGFHFIWQPPKLV